MSQQITITSKLNEIEDLLEQVRRAVRDIAATTAKAPDLVPTTPKLTKPKRIPKGDEWFWSEEWQVGEREVDEQIKRGEVYSYETMDEAIKALHNHAKSV